MKYPPAQERKTGGHLKQVRQEGGKPSPQSHPLLEEKEGGPLNEKSDGDREQIFPKLIMRGGCAVPERPNLVQQEVKRQCRGIRDEERQLWAQSELTAEQSIQAREKAGNRQAHARESHYSAGEKLTQCPDKM
jgi:hypothetical protein